MPESQAFHLGDVLSVTTGYLVSPDGMDGLRRLIGHMAGADPDALGDFGLTAAVRPCAAHLLDQHPALRSPDI